MTPAGRDIVCRGQFNTGVGQMSRIAERLGMVVEIDPDTLSPTAPPLPAVEAPTNQPGSPNSDRGAVGGKGAM
jgi:hypothetical protein